VTSLIRLSHWTTKPPSWIRASSHRFISCSAQLLAHSLAQFCKAYSNIIFRNCVHSVAHLLQIGRIQTFEQSWRCELTPQLRSFGAFVITTIAARDNSNPNDAKNKPLMFSGFGIRECCLKRSSHRYRASALGRTYFVNQLQGPQLIRC